MATQFDPIAKDESLNTTEATPRNIADVIAEGLKGIEDALPTYTEGDGIDISAQKVISVDTTFTEASTRANIASGDLFSTILGKIKKFFTDLKAVAFSGAAADVTYGAGTVKSALDDLTYDSGWKLTPAVSGNAMAYRKIGKTVYVTRNSTGTIPANTATLVGTLPAGYRPNYYAYNGSPSAYLQVSPDGSINAFTPTANYMHPWYVSFIADA